MIEKMVATNEMAVKMLESLKQSKDFVPRSAMPAIRNENNQHEEAMPTLAVAAMLLVLPCSASLSPTQRCVLNFGTKP